MKSVAITTIVVSLNPNYGGVYPIQLYVMKFVIDLRQVSGLFILITIIKLTATVLMNEINKKNKNYFIFLPI
jgi:hypothetical protein